MKWMFTLVLALLVTGVSADTISGNVLDTSGRPIPGATVAVGELVTRTEADGRFELRVDLDEPASMRFGADNFYTAIHTFARADIDAADGNVGNIALVARRPERRLLLFAGDAMLARRFFEPLEGEPTLLRRDRILEDGKVLLGAIRPYVELADFASVNLETQLSSKPLSDRLPKSITFYSPDQFAELLEWAGFDYAALGNNHTWDYQAEGLESTFAALDDTALGYSGAGFDESSARAPFLADMAGKPYAFLSYVGWSGTFRPHQAAEGDKGGAALGGSDVFGEDLAALPDRITTVLQYHSGLEYSDDPALSERTRLREAVDNGADVAIGHHAHVLQGIEIYRNRLIAYSMGNFLFDQTYYTTQLGMLLYVWMDDDELYRAEVAPLYVNGYVPTPATGAMRYSILNRIARLSRRLDTCATPNGAHAVLASCGEIGRRPVDLGAAKPGTGPVPLVRLGLTPTAPVSFLIDDHRYRLGTDILPRGDFESHGRYGIPGRGWITGPDVAVADGDSRHLAVRVAQGAVTRTGMSAFQRVFTLSNPTTLSGRVYASGPAEIRFQLQRRRPATPMAEALASGPRRAVGALRIEDVGWHRFSVDFDQPRVGAESVRLLIEVADDADAPGGIELRFDDLSWVEWRSPWLDGDRPAAAPAYATHAQFRPKP
jgi:poly-gamma-glutamate capsule biosynthesis protein CapA/YwtB (metallophosphatase superfamily)